ncbi:MAG TPA: ABC transporter ATP-binding protein [Candidatus Sulfotelmatobacter sp.]|nr:ABC transporter ATP-binding protein [Candidatus Sulfotelmatobacter sp.]
MILLLRLGLRPYWKQITLVMFLLLVQAIANLYLPNLNADIINNGIAKGDNDYIVHTGGLMLLVTLLLSVCSVVAIYFGARVAMGFGRDTRRAIFRRVGQFSQVELNHFGSASLITRNTNDVQQVQMVVFMALTIMILAPITGIGGVIMAVREDVPLSGLLVVILPLMFIVIALVMRQAVPLFRAMQAKIDRINQVMREALAGVRVIRAFVRTRHEEARFEVANQDLFQTSIRVNRLFAVTIPTMMAILNLSTVAVMWFGSLRIDSGGMPIGNLTAFMAYLMQILMAVLMAIFMFILVPRAAVSSDRIMEVLTTEPSIHDPVTPVVMPAILPQHRSGTGNGTGNGHGPAGGGDGAGSIPAGTVVVASGDLAARPGTVEFRHVEFRYPGAEQPILHDITFTARPGQTTAIVGSTGSGKTTLINLIPRLYDVTGGAVLVDGVDVREMARRDLWDRIGFIPQHAFLFSGTVASNLRLGDEEASSDALWKALEIAQGRDFVQEMDGGLEAPIDQGGTNVSGGQRQRLAIARALVKRAPVYIFDDSFSALDFRTDARLRAALAEELSTATVIIVAQRVGTILRADQIVVLDEGRVVGVGRHHELLETCETYREIVLSQLTAAEAQAA